MVGIDSGTTERIPNLILSNRKLILCFYLYRVDRRSVLREKAKFWLTAAVKLHFATATPAHLQLFCHAVTKGFYHFRDIKSNERSENLFDKNHVSSVFFLLKDVPLFSKIWLVNLCLFTERLVVANKHKMRNSVGIIRQGFSVNFKTLFSLTLWWACALTNIYCLNITRIFGAIEKIQTVSGKMFVPIYIYWIL